MFKKPTIIIFVLAIIFAIIYGSLYFSLRPSAVENDMWIFNTPDEVANYYFIDSLSQNNTLKIYEPLNEVSGKTNLVHPRSTTVINNSIVPVSFLGFVLLLGFLAKIFGMAIVPFITPIFSVLAVVCFYLLIKKIFDKNIAFFSAVALMVMPAFWYYNARSLFNNIIFVDLIIISLFFLFNYLDTKKLYQFILSGLLIGLAISIRPSEVLWVAVVYLVIFILNRKSLTWKQWLGYGALVALPVLPSLYFQREIFGSIMTTGYNPNVGGSGSEASSGIIKNLIVPFGFNLMAIISTLYYYFVEMFWWYFWPVVLGGAVMVYQWKNNKINKKLVAYLGITAFIFVFISVYYGSWLFFNNLAGKPLIGSSQVRYFLPIYISTIPLIAYFVYWAISWIKNTKIKNIIVGLVLLCLAGLSANAVLYQGEESLNAVRETILSYHQINKQVREITPDNAVIVSSYNDKLFFPSRKVVVYWRDPIFLNSISDIAREVPVYFYSINPNYETNLIVDNSTIDPEFVIQINETESLYRLLQ